MRCRLAPLAIVFLLAACTSGPKQPTASKVSSAKKLGIRPHGDETIEPDPSKTPDDLKKVFTYIDDHIDEHVENLQKWIRQPSISNTGEGIPESAEMVKGFFDEFGCQETRVYDVGITEYGTPGNPVVYAKCDEGAPEPWQSTGCTTPCRSPSPTRGKIRRSKPNWWSSRPLKRC